MFSKSFLLAALAAAVATSFPLNKRCDEGPSVNDATLDLIKEFEGFVESPEPDPVGYPTVGYGHLCQSEGCSEVEFDFPLSEEEGTELLKSDLPVRYSLFILLSILNRILIIRKSLDLSKRCRRGDERRGLPYRQPIRCSCLMVLQHGNRCRRRLHPRRPP